MPSLAEAQRPLAEAQRRRRRRLPPGFLSVRDMAALSDSARSTIYRQVELGRLPACEWRGLTVIAESAAEEFLAIRPLRRACPEAEETRHG